MRHRHGIGLAVFCLLAGSRWFVDAEWPDTVPSLLSQSLVVMLAGLVLLVFSLFLREAWAGRIVTMRLAAATALLVAAPAVLGQFAHTISPETSVALYALVPLCIVGVVTFTREDARSLMMPAMAGLAGALLLLPWQLPSTATLAISFTEVLLAVLLTGAASVRLHTLLQGKHLAGALAIVAFTNAGVLGLTAFVHGDRLPNPASLVPELLRALLLELPQLCLLFWLLREVAPERFAARFFLVPLVTIVEGLVVLHGTVDLRFALGVLLLLAGAGALLLGKRDQRLRLDLR